MAFVLALSSCSITSSPTNKPEVRTAIEQAGVRSSDFFRPTARFQSDRTRLCQKKGMLRPRCHGKSTSAQRLDAGISSSRTSVISRRSRSSRVVLSSAWRSVAFVFARWGLPPQDRDVVLRIAYARQFRAHFQTMHDDTQESEWAPQHDRARCGEQPHHAATVSARSSR
jgi:hypothetical protein